MRKIVGGTVTTTEDVTELIVKANEDDYICVEGFCITNYEWTEPTDIDTTLRFKINGGDLIELDEGQMFATSIEIESCKVYGIGLKFKWTGVM